MLMEVPVAPGQRETIVETVLRAFDRTHRKHASARRALQYMLGLAMQRGYRQAELFMAYFLSPTAQHTDRSTQRYINQLLEFVSPDEFIGFIERTRS